MGPLSVPKNQGHDELTLRQNWASAVGPRHGGREGAEHQRELELTANLLVPAELAVLAVSGAGDQLFKHLGAERRLTVVRA